MKRLTAIALLATVLGSCRDNDPTGPHGGVTGVFVLRSINGVALPAQGNGGGMSDFTIIADTLHVHADGFAIEVIVTSRPGVPGVQRRTQELHLDYDEGYVTFDAEYPCRDVIGISASCVAPPHHQGEQASFSMTFTYSVLYRVPMVFERVGPILPL
jgi:hypothetical protein